MDFALPLYAVQRLADGTWLVRTQMGDPTWPAVDVVAVLDAPTSAAAPGARRTVQEAGLRSGSVTPMCNQNQVSLHDRVTQWDAMQSSNSQ
jgi:hypothetical protein